MLRNGAEVELRLIRLLDRHSRSLPLTERMELYLGVIVTVMFLIGCFLTVLGIRERSEQRRRWLGSTAIKRLPAESKTL